MISVTAVALAILCSSVGPDSQANSTGLIRSTQSGPWSAASTWQGAAVPGPGARVQIRKGHRVVFDSRLEQPIRSIHIAGTLAFAPDQDTLMTVGLIKIEPGENPSETGFDEGAEVEPATWASEPALEVGTHDRPIRADRTATIRLAQVEGLDPEQCPALVCRGGRLELQGSPVEPTWAKLGASLKSGASEVVTDRALRGWKVGDRVIVTSTSTSFSVLPEQSPKIRDHAETEVRTIASIAPNGKQLRLNQPLKYAHLGEGKYRGEVGLLSRNVVIESAAPSGVRGHTMVHRNSLASIGFAEFRNLGKRDKLGKYAIHFHKGGESLRGSSVIGASIWGSENRWVTIHGTNHLLIRDCVGFGSRGHGFFLEDGTEVNNVFDRNLAVQATEAKPLPGQVLPFDRNEGAGYWWANCRNAFVRNVAVECDEYGYRFEATPSEGFDPVLNVRDEAGRLLPVDIRTQPFVRFEANEAHALPRWGFNLGGGAGGSGKGGVGEIGPSPDHPLVVKDLKVWGAHWAFTPGSPSMLGDGVELHASAHGLWRPMFARQAYRRLSVTRCRWFFMRETGQLPDESTYPSPLTPKDDRGPVTLINRVQALGQGKVRLQGVLIDDTSAKVLTVNNQRFELSGTETPVRDFDLTLLGLAPGAQTIDAFGIDQRGNSEKTPQKIRLEVR